MCRLLVALLVTGFSAISHAESTPDVWNGRLYDVQQGRFINEAEARAVLAEIRILVLGEKHDTPSVQQQQARALDWAVESQALGPLDRWTLGWEFLNTQDQSSIDQAWTRFKDAALSAEELMDLLQGAGRSRSYLPLIYAGARFGGSLLATNLSRSQKAPVLTGGLSALDPSLIPPGFERGGGGYLERFEAAMGSHAPPEQLENYFQAQCLTDDVMAYELLKPRVKFRALVVGSFHSDYLDGVVTRLRMRAPDQSILSIRFVDAQDYSASELEPDLVLREPVIHKRYGALADWIWFAGEPKR
jgi:uncharacterized iron-regulated protein